MIQISEPRLQVTVAADWNNAETNLRHDDVDAVFMDIAITGENEVDSTAAIRRLSPGARIVALSSHDSVAYQEAAMRKGADYFLSKQHSGAERLLDGIHTVVRGNGDA